MRAIEERPDFLDARVALASVLLAEDEFDQALLVARGLEEDYPDRALGFRIEGATQLAAKKPDAAIEPLKQAIGLEPDPNTVRQLAEAYVNAGRTADAIAMLGDWTRGAPKDLGSQAMLAMLLHGEGMEDRALPIYERLYESGQANLLVLNNLAWILHERGDERALKIAKQAYQLNPNRPEVADTFGWILFEQGERERGLSILQQAQLAYPTQTEIAYHTAVALDAMGRGQEAVTILRRLLHDHPGSAQAPDAQALLDKLTAGPGAG
jgi:tetratricopeptide (TPR) repeat protein